MSFGGGGSKQRQQTTQQTSQKQTQQTQVLPQTAQEQQQMAAAHQSELFRMFLMQKLAQEQFQQPLMTPYAQEGLRTLNEQFRDQRDMRGLGENASPIENARALGVSSYMNQLQNEAFHKRLAMSGVLGPSAGSLGMMGLQQQARIAGSPTTSSATGMNTGATTGRGNQSQSGFDLGSMGNFMTGIGNLYGAGRAGGLWGGGGNSLANAYQGAGYQGGSMWGY